MNIPHVTFPSRNTRLSHIEAAFCFIVSENVAGYEKTPDTKYKKYGINDTRFGSKQCNKQTVW